MKNEWIFLGCTEREFNNGVLDEEDVENGDETHLLINVDNGMNLGFRGTEEVKYLDVTSGGEGMKVRILGGKNS